MSNKITIKRSAVTGKVPEPSDLDYGEFALNYTDGNLFFKSNANVITNLASTQFVSVTGNVTGNYFIGNGSQLTGVTAVAAPAGNINEVQINGGGVTSASANFTFDGTNVSVLGNITGNYFIGNGSGLSAITGSNVTGQVGNALVSGTVYTAAQPNITSVGTLSELTVAGNVQANGTIGIGTVPGIPAISANGKMLVGDSITNANIGNVVNYANSTGTAAYRPINLVDTSAVIKIARLDNGTNGPSIELQQWDTDISTLASRWDLYTTTAGLAIRKLTSPASDAIVVDNDARVLIGSNASINTTSANLMANVANLNLQVLGSAYVSANVGIGTANISAPLTIAYTAGNVSANLLTSDAAIITANATAPGFAFVVAGSLAAHRGVFKGTRARGTLEAPAVPQENDAVVTLLGAIYDGNITRATAGIELTVDGAVSDGVAPQRIAMLTGETNTRVERVSIYGNGVVNVRSTTNSTSTTTGALTVSGGLGVVGNINSGGNVTGTTGAFTTVTGNANATSLTSGTVPAARLSGTYTITVSGAATTAGTVTTAAQPNITSVGTLSSLSVSGNVTGGQFNGSGAGLTAIPAANVTGTLSVNTTGSAASLTTTRAINGTNFDGTAAITTANWGTARNITIGSTTRSVNGSTTYSWSLADIGAQAAGNYVTTDTTQTITGAKTVSGQNLLFADSGTTKRGIMGTVGGSDQWFFGGGATATNAGFLEIATGDDNGTEPIHVRQYQGGSPLTGNITRTLTLLDSTGNTTFPGSISAVTKSFLINHPTKPGKKLRHGSLEGPEHGVYVRGKVNGTVIELPEYWTKLVDPDSITVQLTAISKGQKLYVEDIRDNKVYIANDGVFSDVPNCFYLIQAERVDIEKMDVEINFNQDNA